MTFGQAIKFWRRKVGLSQRKLAEALGVTRNTIQNWESYNDVPDNSAQWHRVASLAKKEGWFDPESPIYTILIGGTKGLA